MTLKKLNLSIVLPWGILICPYFFTYFMNSATGAKGFFFLYYVMYVFINGPLAIISTLTTQQSTRYIVNIIMLLPAAVIFLLGFAFMSG